jgi:hypothetical protein
MFQCVPSLSCNNFKDLLKSLIHFKLIFVQMKGRNILSVCCMQISSFPSNICWRGYLCSTICFRFLCQNSGVCSYMGFYLCLLLCSIDFCVYFYASTMPFYFITYINFYFQNLKLIFFQDFSLFNSLISTLPVSLFHSTCHLYSLVILLCVYACSLLFHW